MCTIREEEIKELAARRGRVRGGVLHTDGEYVRRHQGEEALRRVEKESKNILPNPPIP